ncbi:MAG: hypothetical protein JRD93_20655 [Deltaproteobacteria bacterium]|nr:hypothetical protein [Deltaproteobacteria bacterium]
MKNRLFRKTVGAIFSVILLLFCSTGYAAENIDPDNDGSQYAYGENVGWLNAEPLSDGGPGVEVTDSTLTGYIWGENIGWINLSPTNHGGVSNDGIGNLSGYAWGENVGWINFAPTNGGGVTIDVEGNFDGWAWGENIGWIHFQNLTVPYKVKTAWAPQPEPYHAYLQDFFDESVEAETLVGVGPGKSADLRLEAVSNMIEKAGNFIESGLITEACEQLLDALEKTDGLGPPANPPDLVTGDAADDLAEKIQDLMTLLECE